MQWYMQNPERYEYEVRAVYNVLRKLEPQQVALRDGRRGFIMNFRLPDPEGKLVGPDGAHYQNYRVLMMWNSDHPYSAARSFGGSVKTYFLNPSIDEIEKVYQAHGRARVPHLLYDRHPVTGARIRIPCTQTISQENKSFSMVTAAALVMNWLSAMTAGKYRESAYTAFCKD